MDSHKTAEYQAIEGRVGRHRGVEWRPGKWGSRLTRRSNWVATVDCEALRVDGKAIAIRSIDSVSTKRGAIWSKVLVCLEGGEYLKLGGLTRKKADNFMELLDDARSLDAVAFLRSLVALANRQR